jgi:uncharacterized protein YndB with AHSA1/START domain
MAMRASPKSVSFTRSFGRIDGDLSSDTEVLVKRSFDAPAKLVWRAYMEPDLMRRWCGGLSARENRAYANLRCRRPGRFHGERAVDHHITFQETNGITNVTTTIRYASKADRDAAFATGMTDGMEIS